MNDRLSKLRGLVDKNPSQPMPRYGLAMELKRLERTSEAVREFQVLLSHSPDFVAAYFQLGGALVRAGREEEARQVYSAGLSKAGAAGDRRAADELAAALAELDD